MNNDPKPYPPYDALLIVGPTGSGKTPLGNYLARFGLGKRKCRHFDFGANLRQAAAGALKAGVLSHREIEVVHRVLKTGALLENKNFNIARKLLLNFIQETGMGAGNLLILNGLPRHVDQAEYLAPLAAVGMVICLACSAEIIHKRIRRNSGGDRVRRNDDSPAEISRKISIYQDRTVVLLDYYRSRSLPVLTFPVGIDTRPADILAWLAEEGMIHADI